MLVLSRLKNEVITIGNDVEVKVIDVLGPKVKLGITAPEDVRVDRQEVRNAVNNDRLSKLKALLEYAKSREVEDVDLDEHVYCATDDIASGINNGGLESQIEFLFDRIGEGAVRIILDGVEDDKDQAPGGDPEAK